jgi:alanine racemase
LKTGKAVARSWVEISESKLVGNLSRIRERLGPNCLLSPVVKANAYGHGLNLVADLLHKQEVKHFSVDSLEEALTLYEQGILCPILIMGYIEPSSFKNLRDNFILCLYSVETLNDLERLNRNICIQLKVETGLNRQGVRAQDLPEILERISQCPSIHLVGAYTHYANVEDTLEPSFFHDQFQRFQEALEVCPPEIERHSCASAAALLHNIAHQDMCRIGISLYGYYSSWQTLLSLRERGVNLGLEPILSWKTKVAQVKEVYPGDKVGYGCTHEILSKGKIAVLPVGYYDGYVREYSSKTSVILREQRAPVIGRVAMNMMMVDVSHIPEVLAGDPVILLGQSGKTQVFADELAELSSTINYEVLTRISPHLPRIRVV